MPPYDGPLRRHSMLVTVRNRRGLITSVEPFDAAAEGRVHLVTVEYLDPDGTPEDTLTVRARRARFYA